MNQAVKLRFLQCHKLYSNVEYNDVLEVFICFKNGNVTLLDLSGFPINYTDISINKISDSEYLISKDGYSCSYKIE